MNTITEKTQGIMGEVADNAKKLVKHPQKEMERSSKDWVDYVMKHPMQSVFFGITIYYAIKGFLKS